MPCLDSQEEKVLWFKLKQTELSQSFLFQSQNPKRLISLIFKPVVELKMVVPR